jgi:predicted DNA-binding transcriptional regulator YafY
MYSQDENMRADRLISLLLLLQNHNGLTARQLALELEVSERTIYRDLTALSSAGIPVYTRGGPGGGCFLVEEYRTNLTGMTTDQRRALFALSVPTPLTQLGLSQDLKAALLKISTALPSTSRVEEERDRQRLFLDWGFESNQEVQPQFLKIIQQAVWEDRLIRLRYRSLYSPWIDPLEQLAAPYSLVAWAGDWYAVCQWGDSLHVIRIDLVQSVKTTADSFTRPAGYNLPAFWKEWRHHLEVERPVYAVRVRVAPLLVPYLHDWHPFSVEADGWQTGSMMFETFEQARAKLLPFGGAVIILEPDALRKSTLDFARQILHAYE